MAEQENIQMVKEGIALLNARDLDGYVRRIDESYVGESEMSWGACNVTEMRNGRAIRGRLYGDNASLFQQLGVLSIPRATAAG